MENFLYSLIKATGGSLFNYGCHVGSQSSRISSNPIAYWPPFGPGWLALALRYHPCFSHSLTLVTSLFKSVFQFQSLPVLMPTWWLWTTESTLIANDTPQLSDGTFRSDSTSVPASLFFPTSVRPPSLEPYPISMGFALIIILSPKLYHDRGDTPNNV